MFRTMAIFTDSLQDDISLMHMQMEYEKLNPHNAAMADIQAPQCSLGHYQLILQHLPTWYMLPHQHWIHMPYVGD